MSFEKYTQIYNGEPQGMTVRPKGRSKDITFKLQKKDDLHYRLFTVGETEQFYLWKDEPDGQFLYRMLTDSLDTTHAIKDRYCLSLTCKKFEDYLKRVYKKIMWPPKLSYLTMNPVPTAWELGLTVSAKGLSFREGGFLRMRIDIRLKKDGIPHRSVAGAPDESITIDIPEGSYTAQKLCCPISIPQDAAQVGVFIEGTGYKGECYVEQPFLSACKQNLLPAFNEAVQDRTHLDWTAQHLSRKEWPEFKVRLNGKVIFNGEVFERCHRHSEWEIELPRNLLKETNTVSYELISDYHDPLPYTLYEIGIIEQPAAPLSLLAVSKAAPVGGKARVLVHTEHANIRLSLICDTHAISGKKEYYFREKGLHGILLDCKEPCVDAAFRLAWDGGEVCGKVERIVCRNDDSVITGTGDMVYVHQDTCSMDEYLAWYISNHIGNLVTIRPTYRWSGTRTLNPKVWKRFSKLMNELDMKYVLMADGREVPGLSSQPDLEMLSGKGFLGIQLHEHDGAHFYWGTRSINSLFEEQECNLLQFAYNEDPEHTSSRYNDNCFLYDGSKMNIYADKRMFDDVQKEHKKAVASLAAMRRERDTRHTGPAATFKYMAEAGYSWLGAETMYQTMEPIMGFIRGVAKDRQMQTYGVHHAVQWSSTPHESEARYRRFRIALYASYMQGATDINTEEGLWRLEEYYEHHHRFDKACINHLKQQQDFYNYVSTHTRSGRFYTPIALVHGRDDGITFFGKNKTWGQAGIPQSLADDSWDLIQTIYPKSDPVSYIYRHGCPEDTPQGFHSGTPYGNVDVTPMESNEATWNDYRTLIFLGYNRCENEDAEKLLRFIKRGGRVLITDAHLTETSSLTDIRERRLTVNKNAMVMSEGKPQFVLDTVNGTELYVCENPLPYEKALAFTDSGRPLVCVYHIGDGEVIVFHTKEFPAHKAIRALYENEIKRLCAETANAEQIWAKTGDDVEFTVYEQKDGSRHIYFLAVDWYNDPHTTRHADLSLDGCEYRIPISFGTILKAVCNNNVAVIAESENGEVISIADGAAIIQGIGKVSFRICKDGKQTVEEIDFTDSTVKHIQL